MTGWYPVECEHGYDCCPMCDRRRVADVPPEEARGE